MQDVTKTTLLSINSSISLEDNFFNYQENLHISNVFELLVRVLGELVVCGKRNNAFHMTTMLLELTVLLSNILSYKQNNRWPSVAKHFLA